MGRLVDGQWIVGDVATTDKKGGYDRIPRSFLETVSVNSKHQPETNRYHLYVSYACPWAHRTLIFRELKNLTNHISVSVVSPDMLDDGWVFTDDYPDHLYNKKYLREVYQDADPKISTSVTVPILWDKKEKTIVNNESSEIIRIFNSEFNNLTGNQDDYYPKHLRAEIDPLNEKIYHSVNNGVYKCGFAKTQKAYESAYLELFDTLDFLESHLNNKKYLIGNQLTEADIRLIPTLLRFDLVYFVHFKCNKKRIVDYPNLFNYLKTHYQNPAIKKTTNIIHIKRHYYYSHDKINPYRIIPLGPEKFFE